ncbi:hypothetical protein M409DRAFT_70377 [Zasmidium cellare ATCC 36951]|uniref:MATE efflux family protein n=1 Tax=Zasmidium cellare ATCC 36951 TaxID=1080233 RepID=A0A6A6C106_ZASCE|nr:uncharacterized protein M409DRAFT_70377 [Zasmidium cellare ATCC 36951]KAF2160645.1 hypothetical protein M409DRAFT_70377 [Zasmidium cellare ATCC 36951]
MSALSIIKHGEEILGAAFKQAYIGTRDELAAATQLSSNAGKTGRCTTSESLAAAHGAIEMHREIHRSAAIEEISLRAEAGIFLRYSTPLTLTYLLQYANSLIVIIVASRFSTDELAGVSLGITTSNIIGYAIFEGMATALDTLCSQAYGASRLTDVGMHTIRFTVFVHLVAIPIALLWFFSNNLLLLAHVPSRALAEHAGTFIRYLLISISGYATFEAGKRYMQAQGNFLAGFFVLLACLPIQIFCTWALVQGGGMRVAGAALVASVTNLVLPLLLAGYAMFVNTEALQCWPSFEQIRLGWRKNWKIMVLLAIPGALMSLSEWLCFEILTFCTSYVGTASLAAQTFLSTTAVVVWHIPFSASIAYSTRIGQLVGAGLTASVVKVMRWYALVFACIGIMDSLLSCGIILLMLRFLVDDAEVDHLIVLALPYVAGFVVFDATSNWPHSVVGGFGWQSVGAWVTVTVNYIYAVPLALLLELGSPKLGIRGLWIGLGSGLAIITVVEAVVVWLKLKRMDSIL